MNIVVTGSAGFIGAHLMRRLRARSGTSVQGINRQTSEAELLAALAQADFVFHLAGVNRPKDEAEFGTGNARLTETLLDKLRAAGRGAAVALSSSTQAEADNAYGRSKREAEDAVRRYARDTGAGGYVFRLTNVFGPGARPFYNSAVATFSHQAAAGQALTIHNPAAPLRLVYIDDVVKALVALLDLQRGAEAAEHVEPVYQATVGEVAERLQSFAQALREGRQADAGEGLPRALLETVRACMLQPAAAG
jgi:UDP-2-acetamido-2,6-beta-L-arabino-hexul-4-ose reductase